MNRYSTPVKYNNRTYIYDRDECLLCWVSKLTKDEEYNKLMFDRVINDKWGVVDEIGLSREGWKDKDSRMGYIAQWDYDIECECAYLAADFERGIL